MKKARVTTVLMAVISFLAWQAFAGEYENPRDYFNDPDAVRLSRGKTELTPQEKEEIKKYGFTGLELMVYNFAARFPGKHDRDSWVNNYIITPGGKILRITMLNRSIYLINKKDMLSPKKSPSGAIWRKCRSVTTFPPDLERDGFCASLFIKSEENKKGADVYSYSKKIRRTRLLATLQDSETLGGEMTFYEAHLFLPWDAKFRILGEDQLGKNQCLVVESRSALYPDFYVSKWVYWIETADFRDLHVEYFNKDGELWRIGDKIWTQVKPSGYWVFDTVYHHNLQTKARSLVKIYDQIIDAGLEESEFDPMKLTEERIWRKPPPRAYIKDISELPPLPEIRKDFWEKINTKVDAVE
jgi:hypothetical protein